MKTEVQEWIEAKYRNYFAYIKRPGAADLLQWMDANSFFEAPASKRHHGANPRRACGTFNKCIQAAFTAEYRGRKAAAVPHNMI